MKTHLLKTISLFLFVFHFQIGICQEQDSTVVFSIPDEEIISRLESIEENTLNLSAQYKISNSNMDVLTGQNKNLLKLLGYSVMLLVLGFSGLWLTNRFNSNKAYKNIASLKEKIQSLEAGLQSLHSTIQSEKGGEKAQANAPGASTGKTEGNKSGNSGSGSPQPMHDFVFIANSQSFTKSKIEFVEEVDRITKDTMGWFQDKDFGQYDAPDTIVVTQIIQKFLRNANSPGQVKWRGILDDLHKGVVTDGELIRKIQGVKNDQQKLEMIDKPLYSAFLKEFISNAMILLEELRNLGEFLPKDQQVLHDGRYAEISNLFGEKQKRVMALSEKMLELKINYVSIGKPLKDFAKFANATDGKPISSYFFHMVETVKKLRVSGETYIIEIESYSTNSEHETQPQTIVKAV